LVIPLLHDRLVIVQVHLRRAADHVQIDDLLGLAGEVRLHRRMPGRAIAAGSVGVQKRRKRGPADGMRAGFEEVAASDGLAEVVEEGHESHSVEGTFDVTNCDIKAVSSLPIMACNLDITNCDIKIPYSKPGLRGPSLSRVYGQILATFAFRGTKRISTLWSSAAAMRLSIAIEWPS